MLPDIGRDADPLNGVNMLTPADLDFTARLHLETLGLGLFPKLGVGFMRAQHRTYIDSPHAFALVARSDGAPIGMLFAIFDPQAHRVWLLHHRALRLVARGAVAMAVRPRVASLFFRTRVRRYLRTLVASIRASRDARRQAAAVAAGAPPPPLPAIVLSHIAVIPSVQGNGVGSTLAREFEARARTAGHTHAVLITEAGGDAERFYASHGWVFVRHVVDLDHVKLARYEKQL